MKRGRSKPAVHWRERGEKVKRLHQMKKERRHSARSSPLAHWQWLTWQHMIRELAKQVAWMLRLYTSSRREAVNSVEWSGIITAWLWTGSHTHFLIKELTGRILRAECNSVCIGRLWRDVFPTSSCSWLSVNVSMNLKIEIEERGSYEVVEFMHRLMTRKIWG